MARDCGELGVGPATQDVIDWQWYHDIFSTGGKWFPIHCSPVGILASLPKFMSHLDECIQSNVFPYTSGNQRYPFCCVVHCTTVPPYKQASIIVNFPGLSYLWYSVYGVALKEWRSIIWWSPEGQLTFSWMTVQGPPCELFRRRFFYKKLCLCVCVYSSTLYRAPSSRIVKS